MREQVEQLGLYIDFSKEIDTTDPKYYATTQ
jgi:leucyl-tRNA synthetase